MYTKKINSSSKRILACLLFGLLIIVMGCSQGDTKLTLPPPQLNTLSLIKSVNFRESITVPDSLATDSLAKYLSEYPALSDLLEGGEKRTLFAPSNKAFKNLLKHPIFPFQGSGISSINPLFFQNILFYHMSEGIIFKRDLVAGNELSSNFTDPQSETPDTPEKIIIGPEGTIMGSLNSSIKISSPDNESTNGIFHILGSDILIPPPLLETLREVSGTLAEPVLISANFSIIAELVEIADRNYTEDPDRGNLKVASLLAAPLSTFAPYAQRLPSGVENGLTFFATPNRIITSFLQGRESFLGEFTGALDPDEFARRFLLNHLVLGQYTVAEMTDNAILNNLTGGLPSVGSTSLTVEKEVPNPPDNPLGITINTKKRLTATITSEDDSYSNGILHFIFGELPPD